MKILTSKLLDETGEIIFGFSTKIGLDRKAPFNFNMSLTVGDNEEIVLKNREAYFKKLGLRKDKIAYQKQVLPDPKDTL